jgi:hypothetical protein
MYDFPIDPCPSRLTELAHGGVVQAGTGGAAEELLSRIRAAGCPKASRIGMVAGDWLGSTFKPAEC